MEDTIGSTTEKWVDNVTDLADAYRDLISMRMVEHASLGISVSIIGISALILGLFILLFGGLGFAWWLGEYLANMKAGFFIVGGLYTLIFVTVLIASKKVLIPGIRNSIIKKIYEHD